jgi:hypothetical protein
LHGVTVVAVAVAVGNGRNVHGPIGAMIVIAVNFVVVVHDAVVVIIVTTIHHQYGIFTR